MAEAGKWRLPSSLVARAALALGGAAAVFVGLLLAGGPALLPSGGELAARTRALEAIESRIRDEFPDVPQVSTEQLAARLESGERPLLLDVRRSEEYAVSRLPGALRVEPAGGLPADLEGLDPETPIIAYCSVGYRSSRLVEALREAGFTRAENLEGSLFRWAQEGRALEAAAGPTGLVHPYGRAWAFLVPEKRRSFRPESAPRPAAGGSASVPAEEAPP
ncbi:MAG: rhodanese-like domain-containing protein [Acidobacteriota bacterium]